MRKNSCAGFYFLIKLLTSSHKLYLKLAHVFSCKICKILIFKDTYFEEHFRTAATKNLYYFISSLVFFCKKGVMTCKLIVLWTLNRQAKIFLRKKGGLNNFAKYVGKRLFRSLFFNKVVVLKPATMLKKRLRPICLFVKFVNFLRTSISANDCFWKLAIFHCFIGLCRLKHSPASV